ncbi:hypothetical protein C8J55DRAFT_393696, partial [Lentinula edodes]
GTTDLQCKTLSDIPEDICQLERKFNLDVETTVYAVYSGKPIKTFEVYPFLNWFGRFIALPGIAQYGEAFCEKISDDHPPECKESASGGRFYFELKGSDGRFFIRERGNKGRWFFKFHADFFNIKGNLHGGKHNSTGIMSMSCLNLPLEIREDQAYVYIPGIIQGPREPDAKTGAYNHYLRPIIDEMLIAYTRGVQFASSDNQ